MVIYALIYSLPKLLLHDGFQQWSRNCLLFLEQQVHSYFLLGLFGHYLICCVVFYRSLFVPLLAISLSIFWPFLCLSFDHFIVYLLAISLSIFWSFHCLSFGHFIVYLLAISLSIFWPFLCLSFPDCRYLMTSLVYSNVS